MADLRTNPAAIAQAVEEAAALYRQGRLDEAEKVCTRVLRVRSDWFDALHLLGLIKLQSGKATAALRLLEQALKINPDPAVMSNLGMTLAALNRDAEALAILEKAIALSPTHVEAINNHGNILLKLDRPADALAAFE